MVGTLALACAPAGGGPARVGTSVSSEPPDAVHLTWLSVTNWLVEAGDVRLLLDGYVTRIDRRLVDNDGTSRSATIDRDFVERVATSVLPDRRLDWVLVGHAHWDHGWDTPAWAALTGAQVGGARTVCFQVVALGGPASQCRPLEGGEAFDVGPWVRVRVVRWHHSGDSTTDSGRRLRAPLELRSVPQRDPETGGLRPGFLEDYPNGGGSRAYLITVRTSGGPVTLFWSNTGNPQAWERPVPADSVWMRQQGIDLSRYVWAASTVAPRDALIAAMTAAGLDGVDVWLGFPGIPHVQQVTSVLRPRTFIPQHWDNFWTPLRDGVRAPFAAPAVTAALDGAGVRTVVPTNYFDRFRVAPSGVTPEGDRGARARLGVSSDSR